MSSPFREASEHPNESVVTSEFAQLDPEPQIPWLESFHLRSGLDALTGEPKVSALKRHTVQVPAKSLSNDGPAIIDKFEVEVIHGVHQQSRMHRFEARGTVNSMSPIALNASLAMQTSHISSNHSFLVETIVSGGYDFEKLDLEDLELTSEALALSKIPGEFRKIHGDYFVLGFKRRFWFHALVKCRSNEVADNRTVEASAKIAWRDLLGGNVQAELNKSGFSFDLNATAHVSHSGCNIPNTGGATESTVAQSFTYKDVIQMAKSILTTGQPGRIEIALLAPYSRVLPTLSNTAPVSRGVFNMLHDMEATAIGLHYDCLHPAFERYGDIASEAKAVVKGFRSHRASFITDRTALKDARHLLENAKGKVDGLLARYRFMEELVKEWRGRPQIGKKFEEEAADQRWSYGVVSTDTRFSIDMGDVHQVSLTDGTTAFQVILEDTTRNISPYTQNFLRFESRGLISQPLDQDRDPSTLILSHQPCYIVGWTLSCRTKQPGPMSFSVISGGILRSELKISVKGPIFRQADWRCRIYFVNRDDFDFPQLTSE